MKKINVTFTGLAMFIVIVSSLKLNIFAARGISPAAPTVIVWNDNFNNDVLDSRWTWIREDPTHWSLTSNPGYMHIVTQLGGLLGPGGSANNILLTNAPNGIYRITTKVTIDPTENFQGAAIYVYQDDDNYLSVARRYGNGQQVIFRQEVNGAGSSFTIEETATTVYLRISRDGDNYEGMYSLDYANWISLGQFSQVISNPMIGIGSQGGTSQTEIPTDYFFFQLEDYTNYLFLPILLKN